MCFSLFLFLEVMLLSAVHRVSSAIQRHGRERGPGELRQEQGVTDLRRDAQTLIVEFQSGRNQL